MCCVKQDCPSGQLVHKNLKFNWHRRNSITTVENSVIIRKAFRSAQRKCICNAQVQAELSKAIPCTTCLTGQRRSEKGRSDICRTNRDEAKER